MTLVEASPFDKIWGIGLEAEDPWAINRRQWKGRNLLGRILTNVREKIIREEREGGAKEREGARDREGRAAKDGGHAGSGGDAHTREGARDREGITAKDGGRAGSGGDAHAREGARGDPVKVSRSHLIERGGTREGATGGGSGRARGGDGGGAREGATGGGLGEGARGGEGGEGFEFFSGDHPFHPRYPCVFSLDGCRFNCAEQYSLYRKASE